MLTILMLNFILLERLKSCFSLLYPQMQLISDLVEYIVREWIKCVNSQFGAIEREWETKWRHNVWKCRQVNQIVRVNRVCIFPSETSSAVRECIETHTLARACVNLSIQFEFLRFLFSLTKKWKISWETLLFYLLWF